MERRADQLSGWARVKRRIIPHPHDAPHSETRRFWISKGQFHLYTLRYLTQNRLGYLGSIAGAVVSAVHKVATAKELACAAAAVAVNVAALFSPLPRWSIAVGTIVIVVGLLLWAWDLVERYAATKDYPEHGPLKIEKNVRTDLSEIEPDDEDRRNGFKKVALPAGEFVLRSAEIDAFLRADDMAFRERKNALKPILTRLRVRAGTENALRCKWEHAMGGQQDFRNEPKLCLISDVTLKSRELLVTTGDYFTGWLTNDFCNIKISRAGLTIHDGSDLFPVKNKRLQPISRSGLENVIGVGTIGHTADNVLFFWEQSYRADMSQGNLAPSGSGSCDPRDLRLAQNVGGNAVRVAMMRELLEEGKIIGNYGQKDWVPRIGEGPIRGTEVIGFFRWINRGGKPEFVGATKLNLNRVELVHDWREVQPSDRDSERQADSVSQMVAAIKYFLELAGLSVPLRINLMCLHDAIIENPSRWAKFFLIKQDLPPRQRPLLH